MKNVALHNLGCKVNSYEIDVMQQILQEKGYRIVPFDQAADIYIVNTCTVTNIADRKSRQMLHRAKQLNPDAIVVAVGCYVQTGQEAIEKDDSIDLAIGNNRKKDIAVILEEYLEGRENLSNGGQLPAQERSRDALPQDGISQETAAKNRVPQGALPQDGFSQETAAKGNVLRRVLPQDKFSQETAAKCRVPQGALPQDGFSQETAAKGNVLRGFLPQDRFSQETAAKDKVLQGVLPQDRISQETSAKNKVSHGVLTSDKTLQGTTILDISRTDEYEEVTLKQTAEHTRAYIKIQDGCNQFCSYCVIPYARGRVRSRRPEDVMEEIRGLAEAGYKEIVLTGIHISSYGIDFQGKKAYSGESGLIDLIERIHTIEGLERIRLGSLEPRIMTENTAKRLGGLPKLCPHFHLSLQSGSDTVLKRMNRHYTIGEYYTGVENLRKYFPHPAITTDVIVGFPGETEKEFAETEAFLEKVRFYEMHVFKYSRREGTAAASMPGQVPEQIKTQRSNVLLTMKKRQSAEFRRYYIGSEAEILLEEEKEINGTIWLIGHTRDYVKAAVRKTPELHANETVKVRIQKQLTEEILV